MKVGTRRHTFVDECLTCHRKGIRGQINKSLCYACIIRDKKQRDPVFAESERNRAKAWQKAHPGYQSKHKMKVGKQYRTIVDECLTCHRKGMRGQIGTSLCHACGARDRRKRDPAFAERDRKRSAAWIKAHPKYRSESRHKWNLVNFYGITPQRYDEMALSQNGQCAICSCTPTRRLGVDHDHETGAVRGLLCSSCNFAIGLLKDSPELIDLAAAYLRRP